MTNITSPASPAASLPVVGYGLPNMALFASVGQRELGMTPGCDVPLVRLSDAESQLSALRMELERKSEAIQRLWKERDEALQSRNEWIRENGPGGWIDNMRKELAALKAHPNVEACMALAEKYASAWHDARMNLTVKTDHDREVFREALRKELARFSAPTPETMSTFLRLLAPQPAPARDVVPGTVKCAKCGFTLQRVNLHVGSGTTGPGGEETEPCPNDGTPLLPVTWEEEARDAWRVAEQQFDRAHAIEVAAAELVACKDLKDEESRLRQRRDVAISRFDPSVARVDAMRDDYNRRKPLAWAALRALLPKGDDRG